MLFIGVALGIIFAAFIIGFLCRYSYRSRRGAVATAAAADSDEEGGRDGGSGGSTGKAPPACIWTVDCLPLLWHKSAGRWCVICDTHSTSCWLACIPPLAGHASPGAAAANGAGSRSRAAPPRPRAPPPIIIIEPDSTINFAVKEEPPQQASGSTGSGGGGAAFDLEAAPPAKA